jgi:regulator of replication initiation timing
MEDVGGLITLLAQIQLTMPFFTEYTEVDTINDTLFVQSLSKNGTTRGFSLKDGKVLSGKETRYLLNDKYGKDKVPLSDKLIVDIPVSYVQVKRVSIGKYNVFLFVNDDYKHIEGIVSSPSTAENKTLDAENDDDTKSMSAVVVVDKENDKVALTAFERVEQQYLVFDPLNIAVWHINTINNSVKVSIIYPDHIETRQFKFVNIVLPQMIDGNLWNGAPAPVSGKQYGIFVEDTNNRVGLLTVLNKKLVFLPLAENELKQYRTYEDEGYFVSKINAVVVNESNYVLYIRMKRKLIHKTEIMEDNSEDEETDVKEITVKQGMDNFKDLYKDIKSDYVSTLLLDKQDIAEIFAVFKMHNIDHFSVDIIAVDTLHNKAKKLHHEVRKSPHNNFFYKIRALIRGKYVWLFFGNCNPKSVYVYDRYTGKLFKTFTWNHSNSEMFEKANYINNAFLYDKNHIYFALSPKNSYNATITAINMTNFEKQVFKIKDFNRFHNNNL